MRLEKLEIENFRAFENETIEFNDYTTLVGANGAGKSTVLHALNIFFKEDALKGMDVASLTAEDFHQKNIEEPVVIRLTFRDLSAAAQDKLSHYVRDDRLVVEARADFDSDTYRAPVHQYGYRKVIEDFIPFFDAEKAGQKVPELKEAYTSLQGRYQELPAAKTKAEMVSALHEYEAYHPENCELVRSHHEFYGALGSGKLGRFIQWIYVPAVKHVDEEGQDARKSALGRILDRSVRANFSFDEDLEQIRIEAADKVKGITDSHQSVLEGLAENLQERVRSWTTQDSAVGVQWESDPEKSVSISPPAAGVRAGDDSFLGPISHVGHGMQRAILLAVLQELAESAEQFDDSSVLLLGIEEPELYQHPPQARNMHSVLERLSGAGNQVVVSTHSPYFVSGRMFENVRVVRRGPSRRAEVAATSHDDVLASIDEALGRQNHRNDGGRLAKLEQMLKPNISEMFFGRVPVLVEGYEDSAYLTAQMVIREQWEDFRASGGCIIPVGGKANLIEPVAISEALEIPVFVMYDADGECKEKHEHEHIRDNTAITRLLGADHDVFPSESVFGDRWIVWHTCLGSVVEEEIGETYFSLKQKALRGMDDARTLEKNEVWIARFLHGAAEEKVGIECLDSACKKVLEFTRMA